MTRYRTIKCNLAELIKQKSMTQRDFAAKIGFSYKYINDISKCRSNLTMNNAMTIAKALNVNVEDLYEWEEIDII